MTTWTAGDGKDAGTLAITGGLTIQQVGELKGRLLEACDGVGQVTVDVSAVTEVDVAGLQLLCSCHRYQAGRGGKLFLVAERNADFVRFLNETGFARDFSCNHGGGDGCLWA